MSNRISLFLALSAACFATRAYAAPISLGESVNYAVLGGSTVTNTGPTVVIGNLGVSPGTSVTGFGPGTVTGGTIHSNDASATQAHADATAAYNALASLAPTQVLTGQTLGVGLAATLTPGVYFFSSSAPLSGLLTLDGLGQSNPLFVFQIGSTLTTDSLSSIIGINGTLPQNVFFQIGSSATLGTGSALLGTLIANASDTLTTGASVNGRVIALNGSVTLDSNAITMAVPAPSAAIACPVLLVTGLLARRLRAIRKP